MGVFISLIFVAAFCFVMVAMMSGFDRQKAEEFKSTNDPLYEKYKDVFDSNASDFRGVSLCVNNIESKLLPGEVVIHSYFLPRFYNKDSNLFVLTDKRLIYVAMKLMNVEVKSIPYSKLENVQTSSTIGSELEIESKETTIKIYFVDKIKLNTYYLLLTEKQLEKAQ